MYDYPTIVQNIAADPFTREELFAAAAMTYPDFKNTQIRNLLGYMLKNDHVIRVGRNKYSVQNEETRKKTYKNYYSQTACEIINIIVSRMPEEDFRIWELCWLNEFSPICIDSNRLFIEIRKEKREELITHLIKDTDAIVPMEPSEVDLYIGESEVTINNVISEAPKGSGNRYEVPLEKIIVDLFANKKLRNTIQSNELRIIIEQMFMKYTIDQSTMIRYARRRHKDVIIKQFIIENTDIELII